MDFLYQLTVFVSTVGDEPNFSECMERINRQTVQMASVLGRQPVHVGAVPVVPDPVDILRAGAADGCSFRSSQ